MHPIVFLCIMVGVTLLAWTIHESVRWSRRRQLRQMASQWRMGYAQKDLFNLAGRIVAYLSVADVTDLRVMDVIYGSAGQWHRYVFTAEYTHPVDHGWRRERRVMTFSEPKDGATAIGSPHLTPAPEGLSIIEQYRHLRAQAWGQVDAVLNGAAA